MKKASPAVVDEAPTAEEIAAKEADEQKKFKSRFEIQVVDECGEAATFQGQVEAAFKKHVFTPCKKPTEFAGWLAGLPKEERVNLASTLARYDITRRAWLIVADGVRARTIIPARKVSGRRMTYGITLEQKKKRHTWMRDRLIVGEKYKYMVESSVGWRSAALSCGMGLGAAGTSHEHIHVSMHVGVYVYMHADISVHTPWED